jgi:hypothetical protein
LLFYTHVSNAPVTYADADLGKPLASLKYTNSAHPQRHIIAGYVTSFQTRFTYCPIPRKRPWIEVDNVSAAHDHFLLLVTFVSLRSLSATFQASYEGQDGRGRAQARGISLRLAVAEGIELVAGWLLGRKSGKMGDLQTVSGEYARKVIDPVYGLR